MKPLTRIALFSLFLISGYAPVARGEIVSGRTEKAVVMQAGAQDAVYVDLISKGASPADAASIVDRMSTQEIVYFQSDASRSQAGGFCLIGILIVVILVLLIVYLAQRV